MVAACLLWSRETHAKKCEELKWEVGDLRQRLGAHRAAERRLRQQTEELQQQVRRLEAERDEWANRPCELPPDPPVGTPGFGARGISLAVNLAQRVGLRGAQAVLQMVFDCLGISGSPPFVLERIH